MNPVKEATIQEINLDRDKKYIIAFNFDDDVPKEVVERIMVETRGRLADLCHVYRDNLLVIPFNTTLKDISIEEAKPIKDLLDKMFEEKNDLQ